MTTLETEQKSQVLDSLYCQEKCWDDDEDDHGDLHVEYDDEEEEFHGSSNLSPFHDSSSSYEDEEEEQLNALLYKEGKPQFNEGDFNSSISFMEARKEALEWMIRVNSHHNFTANTLVLGVNYFDKFMINFGFQKEMMPWMIHVAAIACLSLASKIEETHVPLLLDFQVENKQIFEAKVIQRMELLVLSTLEWKMNAVTPLSYFGHLIRKFKIKTRWEILCRCEGLILTAILDPRFLCYVPSVLAAASMLQTLKELGRWSTLQYHNDIMDTLKFDKDKVEEYHKFIQELSSNEKAKRKFYILGSRSPNNVLDVVTSESSIEDLPSITLQPSLEPLPKKCRTL